MWSIFGGMLFFSSFAWGMIGGDDITFRIKDAGDVVFRHSAHVGKSGMNCTECHRLVAMAKINEKRSMRDMQTGRYCGACHNSRIVFGVQDNCGRCHKRRNI